MSLDWQKDVREFSQRFGFTSNPVPTIPDDACQAFRVRLIDEERRELYEAMVRGDVIEVADAIGDLIYVLLGTACAYGINIAPIWNEIQRSNMAKIEGRERGDGTKPLKPPGWLPPRVAMLLELQRTTYDEIAGEYFEARHKTCRNFDDTTQALMQSATFPFYGPIIEFGAGHGVCGKYTQSLADVQVDSSFEMLSLKPRAPGLRVHCDARATPFMDGDFQSACAFLCDPYFGPDFVAEVHRLLKPGGTFIFTMPAYEWAYALRGGRVNATTFQRADGAAVTVPSFMHTKEDILMMLVGFGHVTLEVGRLPLDCEPSGAVIKAADAISVDPYYLPLVYYVQCQKRS